MNGLRQINSLLMLEKENTSRKNCENLIVQIHNFVIQNDTPNRKFIMFHADDINSAKM